MLTEFIRYLSAERRYSPLTVRNYKHDVEQFLAWLDCDESRFDPRSVTTEQIREWIIFRTEEGKLSAGSMNREVASLRAFFRWLHRTGAVEKDIFRMISTLKTSRRLPAFVPESRMTTIVSECGPDSEDFQTERNSLIILMFYACGLRLAELVGIDRSDFSADYTSLRVRGARASAASRADMREFSSTRPLMSSRASRASLACCTRLSPMPSLPTIKIVSMLFARPRSWARCLLVSSIFYLLYMFHSLCSEEDP